MSVRRLTIEEAGAKKLIAYPSDSCSLDDHKALGTALGMLAGMSAGMDERFSAGLRKTLFAPHLGDGAVIGWAQVQSVGRYLTATLESDTGKAILAQLRDLEPRLFGCLGPSAATFHARDVRALFECDDASASAGATT